MSGPAKAARVLSRTLGPLMRPQGAGDPAFLNPQGRSHAAAMAALPADHWDRVVRRFGVVGHHAVLDVGCGSGEWLSPLADLNGRVVGIDVDDEMLERARAQTAERNNIDVRKMPAEALDLPDGAFDAVTCFGTLPYLEQRPAMAEIWRVLGPGGTLVLGTAGVGYYAKHIVEGIRHDDFGTVLYGLDPILVAIGRTVVGNRIAPGSIRSWTPRAVSQLLERAGFAVGRVVRDVEAVNPAWPKHAYGAPLYFVVFATKLIS